uniref:RING-type E3 ubiquitin transferase n=1 Tax=Kalanchoe fedtschenkoi TaxID=63787 RepID=A0A7N0TKM2_KALFE
MASQEDALTQRLQDLQKKLGTKQNFEEAVSSVASLLHQAYPSASPSLRKLFYTVICRVATVLKTRYTAPGFWLSGLRLFEQAERFFSDPAENRHLKSCVSDAKQHLHDLGNIDPDRNRPGQGGYLFEGHLTVDPEPPRPLWMLESNLLTAAMAIHQTESSLTLPEDNLPAVPNELVQELMARFDEVIPEILDNESTARRVPPASKEVVKKLPIITLTNEILDKLGHDAECSICKEILVAGDQMQELPCKHTFHPPCLKPWLDEHNSCPICRHELQTDDHHYESWKEREREAEEDRKGAANAVRGGEYMYV